MKRIAALLIGAGAIAGTVGAVAANREPTDRCDRAIVRVVGDAPVGCDLDGSQRLDVLLVTRAECDRMGGSYVGTDCLGVDY